MTFAEGMIDWQWASTPRANWRQPFGPNQPGIEGKALHPVTQISIQDAKAFCSWAGYRLPSVDEWEVAARAGCSGRWPWGSTFSPKGRYLANTWQGTSHRKNTMQDGHRYTAPVGQYPPNNWGLYDVIGNVFEYCVDSTCPEQASGRGGSWWCSPSTCDYFNLIDVGRMHPKATLANQGFRVVRSVGSVPTPP
jgi:sulfatase modifying factor 1